MKAQVHRLDPEALKRAFAEYREAVRLDAELRRTVVPPPPPDCTIGVIA